MCTVLPVDSGWAFKIRDKDVTNVLQEVEVSSGWTNVTQFPSEVHAELTASGVIKHPYKSDTDTEFQWIGDADWLYATTFQFDISSEPSHVDLHFEGLDTFCTVYLNGSQILKADNMLLPYKVAVRKDILKPENRLLLHFESAKGKAKELEATYGVRRAGSCNLGDPSRVYVRKAQYHWRWDWGPEMMTIGPWRPIYLKTYNASISDLHISANVDRDLSMSLDGCIKIDGARHLVHSMTAVLSSSTQSVVRTERRDLASSETDMGEISLFWSFKDGETQLWWPAKYGSQQLYTLDVTLLNQTGEVLDRKLQKMGFRRVQLIQDPLLEVEGTTFLFEINNQRIFMGGSNWIPADTMLTTITAERYRKWLQTVVDGNQNMLRVWSGGIYEPDVFYDTCDELGILVWQDFCGFACGVYPAHEAFVEQVTAEAEANVKNLRHHPSIIIWCGNNEDYQQIEQWGETAELPARRFYEHVFPQIIHRLSPGVPYWFGSPYGGKNWHDTSDLTVGDVHEWHVWCNVAPGEYYQNYDLLGGRFVSEFGLPSLPNVKTIEYWLHGADASQRHPQSKLMAQHCRAGSFERRFGVLMNENFRMTGDLETYTYLTQLMQSEGLGWAYRSWRRQWGRDGKQLTAGALVWQLNDSWPATSWALIDYFLRKKPSYYVISRELRQVVVGLARKVVKNRVNDRPRQFYEFGAFQNESASLEVWTSNFALSAIDARLELSYYDLHSGSVYHTDTRDVHLPPNQSTEVFIEPLLPPSMLSDPATLVPLPAGVERVELDRTHTVIVHAQLINPNGIVIARATNWPEPYKHLENRDPGLQVEVEGELVIVEAKRPIKCLVLDYIEEEGGQEVKWSDNGIDLFPGDTQTLHVTGLREARVTAAHLGQERARVVQ